MQILKHGTAAPIITCANCSCEFLCDYSDIKVTKDAEGNETKKVTCPECQTETTIK